MIPGSYPLAAGGPPGLLLRGTDVSWTNSGSPTVVIPSDVAAGDLLVHFNFALTSSTINFQLPPGFVEVFQITGGAAGGFTVMRLAYKYADSGDAGTTIGGMISPNGAILTLVAFKPMNAFYSSYTPSTFTRQTTSSTPTGQTITGGTAPLVDFGLYAANNTLGSTTFSPAPDGSVVDDRSGGLTNTSWKIFNEPPVDVSIGMADAGINTLASGYFTADF